MWKCSHTLAQHDRSWFEFSALIKESWEWSLICSNTHLICGASWFTAPHMLTSEKINTWSRGLVKTTQALRQCYRAEAHPIKPLHIYLQNQGILLHLKWGTGMDSRVFPSTFNFQDSWNSIVSKKEEEENEKKNRGSAWTTNNYKLWDEKREQRKQKHIFERERLFTHHHHHHLPPLWASLSNTCH